MPENTNKTTNSKGGRPKLTNKKFNMGFAMEPRHRDLLESIARKYKISMSTIIQELVDEYAQDYVPSSKKRRFKNDKVIGRPSLQVEEK